MGFKQGNYDGIMKYLVGFGGVWWVLTLGKIRVR